MKARTGLTDLLTPLGYALALIISSANAFQKYLGASSLYLYMVGVLIAVWLIWKHSATMSANLSQKQALWLTALLLFLLTGLFLVGYPLTNAGFVVPDSDRDASINDGVMRLLAGAYPYAGNNYMGTPISVMPGALFLSIPFVLLGNGAYQVLFWLIIFLITVRAFLLDNRQTLFMLLSMLLLSPKIVHELITGGDLTANVFYIFVGMILLSEALSSSFMPAKVAAAIFLGVTLSARGNFLFLLPLLLSLLVQKTTWKSAITYLGISSLTFALVTLPFWLYDPAGFTPFDQYTGGKLSRFDSILPYSGLIIPLMMILLTLALALRQRADYISFFRNCAIVQAFPVICGILIPIIRDGRPFWTFGTRYGFFFLLFAATAFWLSLAHRSNRKNDDGKNDKIPIRRSLLGMLPLPYALSHLAY